MVLLKNDGPALPLKTSLRKVAVIGLLPDSTLNIEGGWTVEGPLGSHTGREPD